MGNLAGVPAVNPRVHRQSTAEREFGVIMYGSAERFRGGTRRPTRRR